MINLKLRLAVCIFAVASLVGACSSAQDKAGPATGPAEFLALAKQAVTQGRAEPPPKMTPAPGVVAQLTEPVLQINPEIIGGSDFLRLAVSRPDSGAGTVEVWNSSVLAQVFMRNGVLIGTRGVGGDIIASNANMTVRALKARATQNVQRTYVISDGDRTSTEYIFRCSIRNLGVENISVAYQQFETVHMQEDCTGGPTGQMAIRNDYWLQQTNNIVRKSRQWVGPRAGYFEMLLLRN